MMLDYLFVFDRLKSNYKLDQFIRDIYSDPIDSVGSYFHSRK
jgi:hypothetical protein